MVMRNRNDGAGAGGWWDDLPPLVKKRVRRPEHAGAAESPPERPHEPTPLPVRGFAEHEPYRPAVLADLSRLVGVIFAVALANLVFLLVALSFLSGRGPFGF